MSGPAKKREVESKQEANSNDEDSDSSENEEGEEYKGTEPVQVDFEGRSPIDSDFDGIKQLLKQIFLKAHINLSELSDLIISQGYVSSVLKQSEPDEPMDDDEDDDDPNEVFGVTTVINLSNSRECAEQLRDLLAELCKKHGSEKCNALVQSLLANHSRPAGLVINERFVNIPAQVSVPLLTSLSNEMKRAVEKNKPYDFSYLVFICKIYKMEGKQGKKKKPQDQLIWSNPEEEVIDEESECKFEFCVKDESDEGLTGNWMEEDDSMTPYRRVLFLPANKLDHVINQIKEAF